jgi:hypothetical protein
MGLGSTATSQTQWCCEGIRVTARVRWGRHGEIWPSPGNLPFALELRFASCDTGSGGVGIRTVDSGPEDARVLFSTLKNGAINFNVHNVLSRVERCPKRSERINIFPIRDVTNLCFFDGDAFEF